MLPISTERAQSIIAEVAAATSAWRNTLAEGGVNDAHFAQLQCSLEFGQRVLATLM